MKAITIHFVDSFTIQQFSGNPAAVCLTESPLSEHLMQQIAAEINLSETAFLYPTAETFHLRWFTPKAEVALCGHATLASAFILWDSGFSASDSLAFDTLSGRLIANRVGSLIELDFPVETVSEASFSEDLIAAIGCRPIFMGRTAVRFFAEIESDSELRALKPDFSAIAKVLPGRVIVTAKSNDPKYDFISRYFAPGIGIAEDPVTGSAHCALADYWSKRLQRTEFAAYQASERGGDMKVKLHGGRVLLLGTAVKTMTGEMTLR